MKKGRLRYFAASFLMLLSTITSLGNGLLGARTVHAAANDAPANEKRVIDNHDGTYTIALSVVGAQSSSTTSESTKANVVLVVDTSNSMNGDSGTTSEYVYTEFTGNGTQGSEYYGKDEEGDYFRVYWRNNVANNTSHWRTTNNNNGPQYSGTVYTRSGGGAISRINAEKDALTKDGGIIDNLLSQNVPGDPNMSDIIEVSIVNFGTRGSVAQTWTTDKATIKNTINGLTTSTGTNWEEALSNAKSLADAKKTAQPNEDVYVIFMTDGEPTTHHDSYNVNTNYATEWGHASDDARSIVTAGYKFYALFTWGSGNSSHYLSSLVQYAYTGTGNSNSALSSEYAGFFTNATNTSALIDALTQIVNDITTGVGYTNIEMTDGVTQMTASNVKANAGGDVSGVKYYRSGGSYGTADFDNGNFGTEWTNAPKAKINDKGEVDWDLDDIVLENGVTYTITFVVWPKQESLDLVADLNNGKYSYNSLSPEQKAQISVSGGKYYLKTNTDYPTLTYSTVTTTTIDNQTTTQVSDPTTINMVNDDPVELEDDELAIEKLWEDTLDEYQREEVESVKLFLKIDDDYYDFDASTPNVADGVVLTEDENGKWVANSISIAPGVMISDQNNAAYESGLYKLEYKGKTYSILEKGHTYEISEDAINNHFELTAYKHHPMIVDGKVLSVTFTTDDSGNFTGIEDIYEMDSLSATNTLKGGINISKKVVDRNGDEVDTDKSFDVKVHLKGSDGQPYKYTDYRIYYGENNPKYENPEEYSSTGEPRSGHLPPADIGEIEETIYVGDTIRVVNVDEGTMYYVEESGYPSCYVMTGIDYQIHYGKESDKKDTADDDGYYTVHGNSSSSAVITNKYTASGELELTATKELVGRDWLSGESYDFVLYDKDGKYDTQTVDDNETVTFKKINYTEADLGKTFTYTIKEEGQLKPGVQKSNDLTVTVTLEDDGEGHITAVPVYANDVTTITNTYSASGSIQLKVNKLLTGREWNDGETYTFELKYGEEGNITVHDTQTIGQNGEVRFKALNYDQDDINQTYNFTIEETGTLPAGVTNGGGKVYVKVHIADKGDGTLDVSAQYSTDGRTYSDEVATITNAYEASGKAELEATKELVGREWKDGETFTFGLYKKVNGEDVFVEEKTVSEDKKTVKFEIPYTEADAGEEYTYAIKETTDLNGKSITNSGDIAATVKVTDNGDGTLSAPVSYKDNKQTITNTYTATGEITFYATKQLTGREWKDGETFTFSLYKIVDGEEVFVESKAVTASNKDRVEFTTILYDESDINARYEYVIKETGELPSGIAKPADLPIYVSISDKGDGSLQVVEDFTKGHLIKNEYKADGDATIEVSKEIVGRDWITAGDNKDEFTFELSGENFTTRTASTSSKDEPANFGTILYTEADAGETYYYTIKETTDLSGLSMTSSGELTVKVVITDDGDGNLSTKVSYSSDGENYTESGKITNTYTAKGSAELVAIKQLVGRDWLKGENYDFVLKEGNTELDRETVGGNVTVHFDEIEYDQDDAGKTFTYTITEEGTLKPGVTKSADITATVKVTDNGDGTLKTEVSYTNDDKIVNTYKAEGSIKLEIEKELVGRDWQDDESYTFALEYGDDNTIYDRQVLEADGKATFKALEFNQDDAGHTYTYTIEEVSDLPGGVTNSGSVTVKVKIEDNGDGTLKVTAEYTNDDKIVNTYKAEGSIKLEAKKELVGRDWLKGESYDFVLYDKDGKYDTQTVDANETVAFKEIKYTEADAGKTFTYTISEEGTLKPGVTKSDDITATVKVSDNGDGTLKVEATYTNNGTITNTYTTKPVKVSTPFTVEKTLDDQSESHKDVTFTFELRDGEEVLQTKTIDIAKGDLGGSVDFDEMTFDKAGTYTYTLVEKNDGQKGYDYDATEHQVVVTVEDKEEEAQLYATVKIDGEEVGKVTFENTYKAEESDPVTISIEKALTGLEDMEKAKEFEFVLSDEEGNEIETAKIKGAGEAGFSALTFDKAGTYTYTIKENNGGAKGYEYDSAEYTVTIVVTDEDAKLVANVSYKKDGEDATEIKFSNKYTPEELIYGCPECKVPLGIQKTLTGRELIEGEFTFEIYLDGELVTTGYNTADGRVLFEYGLAFSKPGTYNFTVKENVEKRQKNMVYDENEYAFTIVVEDTGEGELEVVEDTSGEVMFINRYEKDPGHGEDVPKTFDGIMTSIAMFAISLIGFIGGVLFGKRQLKKAE